MIPPETIDQAGVTINYGNESVYGIVASELISIAGTTEPFTSYEVVDQRFGELHNYLYESLSRTYILSLANNSISICWKCIVRY